MTYITQAITLKYHTFREHDRMYTVYSRDFGKLTLLARGSNKIKSKLAGHLEPCMLSTIMFAEGKRVDILAQAQTLESFVSFRRDADRLRTALISIESIERLTFEREADQDVFDLLVTFLKTIETRENFSAHAEPFLQWYLLHLLIHLGFAADIKHEKVLYPLLIAKPERDDIIVADGARMVIKEYLRKALDEKRIYGLSRETK